MKSLGRIPLRIAIFIFSCLIILFVFLTKVFNDAELILYDTRFRLRPVLQASSETVFIEISDDTLKNLGVWPLPRDFHTSMVSVLKECGVKAMVFDLLFSEPTSYDAGFSEAIKGAGNVYLPLAFDLRKGTILADVVKPFFENCRGIGHINISLDSDGKVRKVPLLIKYNGKFIPQLGLKVACDVLGLNSADIVFKRGKIIIDRRLVVPVMGSNYLLVNYPGKWEESFQHYSYFEILKSYSQFKEGKKPDLDLNVLKGKICFVGLTAAGTSDLRAVPLENTYPLVGLQASVFNSVINRRFIIYAGDPLNILLAFLVFALSLTMCLKLKPFKALLGNLILGTVYFFISTLVFILFGIWIDLFLPLFIILAVYVALTVYRFFAESRKRALLEKELEIAQAIQKSFLPQGEVDFEGMGIASFIQPAKFVAGDLYDFIKLDDKKVGVLIGDVSGKGVSASLIMAQVISLFRIFLRQCADCAKVLTLLNKELAERASGRFVTCMCIIIDIDLNKVCVSSAGHAPLLLSQKNGVCDIDLNAGLPLGISEETEYELVSFNIEKGDKLIIFTDGLTEARSIKEEEFGLKAVKSIISRCLAEGAKELSVSIVSALNKFTLRRVQHDDITLVILERK